MGPGAELKALRGPNKGQIICINMAERLYMEIRICGINDIAKKKTSPRHNMLCYMCSITGEVAY